VFLLTLRVKHGLATITRSSARGLENRSWEGNALVGELGLGELSEGTQLTLPVQSQNRCFAGFGEVKLGYYMSLYRMPHFEHATSITKCIQPQHL